MNRKEIAQQTLKIQQQKYYQLDGKNIDIADLQEASEKGSFLLTPEQGHQLIDDNLSPQSGHRTTYRVVNQSTVQAIIENNGSGQSYAVLNFASAKNPGGGFLGGAMAQEEALAASSGLYSTLLLHDTYYTVNRNCGTMMYTDHAIYSPDVVFFRDQSFHLLSCPVTASVLTIPAVNMGQVIQKGENVRQAEQVMRNRMKLCLAIFASRQDKQLILGAYGCGVFRNNPEQVAQWWKELLEEEGYNRYFNDIIFAVLDRSEKNINSFLSQF